MKTIKTFLLDLLIMFALTPLLIACDNDQVVYSYVVVKPNIEDSMVNEWRPVMRVTYRVGESTVVSEVAGLLDEYKNCSIHDLYNWQCKYEDDTGENTFGFKDATYYRSPSWGSDVRHVSRWEYNLIRCKWFQHDNGRVAGMAACLKTYI